MKTGIRLLMFLPWFALVMACDDGAPDIVHKPVPVAKTATAAIYVHIMPWFESASSNNGNWGIHWTMANKNPDVIDPTTGERQIASHFYPLTGPYASGDTDVLEYQLLLMKYSGIDGVLIDWYGSLDLYDYALNQANTRMIASFAEKTGLKFALVYEDRTIASALDAGRITNDVVAATDDMQFLRRNYLTSDAYLTVNGAPVILVFGPQHFHSESEWTEIFSVLPQKPEFWTLWYEAGEAGANATGEFAWIYQDQNPHYTHLSNFYNRTIPRVKVGSVYPGFKDYYKEGGWGNNLFTIEHNGTATFGQTLDLALEKSGHIQINTWNDYGEGTMIEPTVEFGYSFLTVLQSKLGVAYSQQELELIAKLYQLRIKYSDPDTKKKLDEVFNYLIALKVEEAAELLNSIE